MHIQKIHRLAGYAAVLAMIFAAFFFGSFNKAHANPSYLTRANNTSTATAGPTSLATTSRAWQTAGNATSTIVLNTNIGTLASVDNLSLKLYRTVASTLSATTVTFEYSSNCDAVSPDWYSSATTSPAIADSIPTGTFVDGQTTAKFTWVFASTTVGGGLNAGITDSIIFPVPVYERCVRAVITAPAGSASSSIYAEFVGKRENN